MDGANASLTSLNGDECSQSWYLGIIYNAQGEMERRDRAWEEALRCSPAYIPLIRDAAYEHINLAESATQAHPDQASAWFWLAELFLEASPQEAIHAYWQGLQLQPHNDRSWAEMGRAFAALDPQDALQLYESLGLERLTSDDPLLQAEPLFILASILKKKQPQRAIQLYRQGLEGKLYDGVRWYELGDLLAESDPGAALAAYHQSCNNGDPGSHGCFGAGLMAEAIGDFPLAIQYYRRSRYEGAVQRAGELEKRYP